MVVFIKVFSYFFKVRNLLVFNYILRKVTVFVFRYIFYPLCNSLRIDYLLTKFMLFFQNEVAYVKKKTLIILSTDIWRDASRRFRL
jgi:hypothetical protein